MFQRSVVIAEPSGPPVPQQPATGCWSHGAPRFGLPAPKGIHNGSVVNRSVVYWLAADGSDPERSKEKGLGDPRERRQPTLVRARWEWQSTAELRDEDRNRSQPAERGH